jgi:hypothetical protein
MCITVPISSKHVVAERNYADTFHNGFNSYRPINIEKASGNYLMSFSAP